MEYFDISAGNRATLQLSRKIDGNKVFRIDGVVSNFRVSEFACKDGSDGILIDTALVVMLQKVRSAYGQPVYINSAYRTASHNKAVGGSPTSQHLYGRAADIRIKNTAVSVNLQLLQTAERAGANGLGLYGDFCHVDTREKKSCFLGSGALSLGCLIHNNSFLPRL